MLEEIVRILTTKFQMVRCLKTGGMKRAGVSEP